jgi:hypothetical protein
MLKQFIPLLLLLPVGFDNPIVTERQLPESSENHAKIDAIKNHSHSVRIVFYNLENLLDPHHDTTASTNVNPVNELKRWSYSRFFVKLNNIAKTLIAIGGWEPPAVIGICEVDDRYVLNKMIFETPLMKYKYKFIHYESADIRGIDVALLYRPLLFNILFSRKISIYLTPDSIMHTRDILYVKGVLFKTDTVHFFVNHWPSRLGGFTESISKRTIVARTLRSAIDTLQQKQKNPHIIIMGDFNDEPDQPAINVELKAKEYSDQTSSESLVDLMLPLMHKMNYGTYKYQGKWTIIDQFIVSGNILLSGTGLQTSPQSVYIYRSANLIQEDEHYFGGKPFRTYSGPKYLGGFSDHLPIYLDVWSGRRK